MLTNSLADIVTCDDLDWHGPSEADAEWQHRQQRHANIYWVWNGRSVGSVTAFDKHKIDIFSAIFDVDSLMMIL